MIPGARAVNGKEIAIKFILGVVFGGTDYSNFEVISYYMAAKAVSY